jgi:aspartyl-tRNA(Asn)/glutamyl-tRNA(Gln) amidotransferase subunit A
MHESNDAAWSRRAFVRNMSATAVALMGGFGPKNLFADAGQGTEKRNGADTAWISLTEAAQLVRSKKISPVELTEVCLRRIERLNPKLNAFITVTAESAMQQAREAEAEIQKGRWRGQLHGIPIALKDLFDTAGVRTTAASAVFKDRVPGEDAEVVRRLKSSGAVLLGKLNMHEFAFGGSSVISSYGPVHNPWSPDYIAGGSSGGSAAAVAAGLCYGALGSDTGGSIREPSAYCGIVGLKPTYGRVSTRGAIPLSWFLDHVGPMTRTVADSTAMLQVIAGHDAADSTSADVAVPDYSVALTRKKRLRVGVPRAFFYESLHPDVENAMNGALSEIRKIAESVRDIEFVANSDTNVLRAEAFAFHETTLKKSPELYQPETLKRIRGAGEITAPAYIQARRQLENLRRSARATFESVDVLITPTTPVPPLTISELLADLDNLRPREVLMLRNTRPFNNVGLPTISVPCGVTKSGLPIGMQITGAPWAEENVLQLAQAYEQQTSWHTQRPKVEA